MISKDVAKWFDKEQRKAICEWCKDKKCPKCGFTEVPFYKEEKARPVPKR